MHTCEQSHRQAEEGGWGGREGGSVGGVGDGMGAERRGGVAHSSERPPPNSTAAESSSYISQTDMQRGQQGGMGKEGDVFFSLL